MTSYTYDDPELGPVWQRQVNALMNYHDYDKHDHYRKKFDEGGPADSQDNGWGGYGLGDNSEDVSLQEAQQAGLQAGLSPSEVGLGGGSGSSFGTPVQRPGMTLQALGLDGRDGMNSSSSQPSGDFGFSRALPTNTTGMNSAYGAQTSQLADQQAETGSAIPGIPTQSLVSMALAGGINSTLPMSVNDLQFQSTPGFQSQEQKQNESNAFGEPGQGLTESYRQEGEKYGIPAQNMGVVMGNAGYESGGNQYGSTGLDPEAYNPAGGGMGALGLFGYRGDRQSSLMDDGTNSLAPLNQVDHALREIQDNPQYAGLYDALQDPGVSIPSLTKNFVHSFERPGAEAEANTIADRTQLAKAWANALSSGQGVIGSQYAQNGNIQNDASGLLGQSAASFSLPASAGAGLHGVDAGEVPSMTRALATNPMVASEGQDLFAPSSMPMFQAQESLAKAYPADFVNPENDYASSILAPDQKRTVVTLPPLPSGPDGGLPKGVHQSEFGDGLVTAEGYKTLVDPRTMVGGVINALGSMFVPYYGMGNAATKLGTGNSIGYQVADWLNNQYGMGPANLDSSDMIGINRDDQINPYENSSKPVSEPAKSDLSKTASAAQETISPSPAAYSSRKYKGPTDPTNYGFGPEYSFYT